MKRLLAALALVAAGCSTGESGADGTRGDTALIRTDAEPAGANCELGGTRLSIGLDANGDAVLAEDEVSEVRYVCHGDGIPALYAISDGADSCPAGGHTIHWGLDTDGDGSLGEQEQVGSFSVCDGAVGATGAAGSIHILEPIDPGDICPAGGFRLSHGRDADGDGVLDPQEIEGSSVLCNGTDGQVALVEQVELKAGNEHCPNGGVLIRTGLDIDGSGTLDPDEVEGESILCQLCPHPGSSNCTSGNLVVSAELDLPFSPARLAVGDVDGDGHQDILVNDSDALEVHFLRGQGDGTFDPPAMAVVGASRGGPMVLADFDGDGHLDLVGGHLSGAAFAPGNGDGTFGTPIELPLSDQPKSIEWTAIDDDGLPDLQVSTASGITLFRSVGDSTFSSVRTFSGPNLHSVPATTGDVDGDGDLDLVVGAYSEGNLAVGVSLNQGDGTYSDLTIIDLTARPYSVSRELRLGDVDGDGHLDVVIQSRSTASEVYQFDLALGDGQGGFTYLDSRVIGWPQGLELADFNGDGFLDIATNVSGGFTSLYPMDATSIGGPMFQTMAGSLDLALGDFNDDRKVDVVVTDQQGRRLTVLLGD